MNSVRTACVQVNASTDLDANLATAETLVREARDAGAELIALPENAVMLAHGRRAVLENAYPEADHPGVDRFTALARETGAHLLIGSMHIRVSDDRCANRSFLFAPTGEILARYDKIHMFDVDLPGGESYRESKTFRPGENAVLADTALADGAAKIGLTICYDVRFAHLYRGLAKAGANILAVPAAFTRKTGTAHWHVLLRARAIETGCFVIAPAQTGTHDQGRETYGHSLIVAPWGEVLADGGDDVGFVVADLDLARVDQARSAVPAIFNDRDYAAAEDRPPVVRHVAAE